MMENALNISLDPSDSEAWSLGAAPSSPTDDLSVRNPTLRQHVPTITEYGTKLSGLTFEEKSELDELADRKLNLPPSITSEYSEYDETRVPNPNSFRMADHYLDLQYPELYHRDDSTSSDLHRPEKSREELPWDIPRRSQQTPISTNSPDGYPLFGRGVRVQEELDKPRVMELLGFTKNETNDAILREIQRLSAVTDSDHHTLREAINNVAIDVAGYFQAFKESHRDEALIEKQVRTDQKMLDSHAEILELVTDLHTQVTVQHENVLTRLIGIESLMCQQLATTDHQLGRMLRVDHLETTLSPEKKRTDILAARIYALEDEIFLLQKQRQEKIGKEKRKSQGMEERDDFEDMGWPTFRGS